MRQALFLCAVPKGFLLQTIPQRAVQPLGTPGQRPGYRGLADPQLLCDVRDPFALGEVHPQQLRCRGVSSSSTAKGRFTSRRRICWRLSSCCPCCHSCRLAISSGS